MAKKTINVKLKQTAAGKYNDANVQYNSTQTYNGSRKSSFVDLKKTS